MGNGAISDARASCGPRPGERFPLTDAQAEKWLGGRYNPQAVLAFGEAFELIFEGPLDTQALAAALNTFVGRHEALAMRFLADGSAQVYDPPSRVGLEHRDFSAAAEPLADYWQFCRAQSSIPFDPSVPPLLRMYLCRLSPDSQRLFLIAHHLVVDGWSLRVATSEIAALYGANCRGQAPQLARADSWSAYVRAERARRDGEQGKQCLQYWLAQFREAPEPLRLPTDRARTAQMDFAAASVSIAFEPALWRSLRIRSRQQSVTRFCLLLTGYFVLLHRLTGQTDLVCGVPFAGAAQGSGARVVGDTDNTLPLRVQVDPDEPLPSLVARVHRALKAAAAHQDISLGRIVGALQLPREAGRMLLVESIVSLAPSLEKLRFDGTDCRLGVLPRVASPWELGFYWWQTPGQPALDVQYRRALYDESTIRSWAALYIEILGALAEATDATAASLDLSRRCEPGAFSLINENAPADGDAASLPALLETAFGRFAGRCAVQSGMASLDYAELDARSRRMAQALLERGVVPGQLIGVALPRGVDMLMAVIAVLRAGAAYVPLDPAFPEQRLQRMAEHSGLRHIIGMGEQRLPVSVLAGRDWWPLQQLTAPGADARDLPDVGPDDLAYVLYTSGSTGEPKGVRILHRNLVNFLCAMRESPGFGQDDVICAATTLSFDIAALELYLPLLCGGQVVIADDNEHRDPEALCRLIERHRCTVLQTTPSLISLLQEVGRIEALRPLRLLVGGEALPLPLAEALIPRCRELWNLYGPTETTVWSGVQRMRAGARAVPLGQPIARTRLYVLDALRRPALPHALGEIWIGGAGVADGYLHRPDLSAERFLPDPFAGDGSPMYRTGDMGRIHDGQLYFHGRADEQIKLRGFRIEPGDIEAAAAAQDGVAECVAVARTLTGGDQVLALYVGSDAAPEAMVPLLRQRLTGALPAYMRPQYVVVMRSLPKTPNGKIDRRALPAPDSAEPFSPRRRLAPRDPLEQELCEQWQRLLQREEVGVEDDFFELGGYSLLAVRMFTELHERFGVDLPLATLIDRPTVAGLAEVLREAQVDKAGDAEAANAQSSVWRPLVELRKGGARLPLFLFHAVGGNVLNYLPLLDALDAEQPVYGLQSPGLDGVAEPLDSIEAMADTYVREIQRVCPAGPYLLAGGSMGGILALEAARRLIREGRRVAMLVMFDTYCPHRYGDARLARFKPWLWVRLYAGMKAQERRELWRRQRLRLLELPWLRLKQRLGITRPVLSQAVRIHRVERSNHRALRRYLPQRYPGRVHLFRTVARRADDDPSMGWDRWIEAGVDVSELPGRHHDFIDQPELGKRLRECIDAVP